MQENYRTFTMKMNYNERLLYHQEHSLSIMLKYKEYIEGFKKQNRAKNIRIMQQSLFNILLIYKNSFNVSKFFKSEFS